MRNPKEQAMEKRELTVEEIKLVSGGMSFSFSSQIPSSDPDQGLSYNNDLDNGGRWGVLVPV